MVACCRAARGDFLVQPFWGSSQMGGVHGSNSMHRPKKNNGLRENHGKSKPETIDFPIQYWFPVNFPLNQSIEKEEI